MKKNKIKPKIKKLSLQQADIIKTHGNNKKLINLINKIKYTLCKSINFKYNKLVQKLLSKKITSNLHFLLF